jgi:hypothetical protein
MSGLYFILIAYSPIFRESSMFLILHINAFCNEQFNAEFLSMFELFRADHSPAYMQMLGICEALFQFLVSTEKIQDMYMIFSAFGRKIFHTLSTYSAESGP